MEKSASRAFHERAREILHAETESHSRCYLRRCCEGVCFGDSSLNSFMRVPSRIRLIAITRYGRIAKYIPNKPDRCLIVKLSIDDIDSRYRLRISHCRSDVTNDRRGPLHHSSFIIASCLYSIPVCFVDIRLSIRATNIRRIRVNPFKELHGLRND